MSGNLLNAPRTYIYVYIYIYIYTPPFLGRVSVAKVLDSSRLSISKFELQSHYCIHFQTNTLGKGMNFLIPPAMG